MHFWSIVTAAVNVFTFCAKHPLLAYDHAVYLKAIIEREVHAYVQRIDAPHYVTVTKNLTLISGVEVDQRLFQCLVQPTQQFLDSCPLFPSTEVFTTTPTTVTALQIYVAPSSPETYEPEQSPQEVLLELVLSLLVPRIASVSYKYTRFVSLTEHLCGWDLHVWYYRLPHVAAILATAVGIPLFYFAISWFLSVRRDAQWMESQIKLLRRDSWSMESQIKFLKRNIRIRQLVVKRLRRASMTLRHEKTQLEQKLDKAQAAATGESNNAATRLQEHQVRLVMVEQKLENARSETANAKRDVKTAEWDRDQALQQKDTLEDEIRELQQNKSSMQMSLKEKDKALADLKKKRMSADSRATTAETQSRNLAKNNEDLEKKLTQKDLNLQLLERKSKKSLEALRSDATQLTSKLEELTGEKQTLIDKISALQQTALDYNKEKAKTQQRAQSMSSELQIARSESSEWKEKYHSAQQEQQKLVTEIQASKTELQAQLDYANARAKRDAKDLEAERNTWLCEKGWLEDRLRQLQSSLDGETEAKALASTKANKAEDTIKAKNISIAELEARVASKESEISSLKSQLESVNANLGTLRQSIAPDATASAAVPGADVVSDPSMSDISNDIANNVDAIRDLRGSRYAGLFQPPSVGGVVPERLMPLPADDVLITRQDEDHLKEIMDDKLGNLTEDEHLLGHVRERAIIENILKVSWRWLAGYNPQISNQFANPTSMQTECPQHDTAGKYKLLRRYGWPSRCIIAWILLYTDTSLLEVVRVAKEHGGLDDRRLSRIFWLLGFSLDHFLHMRLKLDPRSFERLDAVVSLSWVFDKKQVLELSTEEMARITNVVSRHYRVAPAGPAGNSRRWTNTTGQGAGVRGRR